MASHSSILTWKIPWTGKPGGLQSMRLLRVRRNCAHTSVIGIFCSRYCARIFLLAPGGFHSVLLSGHHGTTRSSLCPPLSEDRPSDGMYLQFSSVQSLSRVLLFANLPSWTLLQGRSAFVEQEACWNYFSASSVELLCLRRCLQWGW